MDKTVTWAVVTDGNYIKIMVNDGGRGFQHLRAGDFDQTSDLTYKLITSKRDEPGAAGISYFSRLLGEFLCVQLENKAFDRLVLVAPEAALEEIRRRLPEKISRRIEATVPGDFLQTPLDDLEEHLTDFISNH